MGTIDRYLLKLFERLTNQESSSDKLRIFQKHNSKLDTNGDVSFPINISAWRKYIEPNCNSEDILLHAGIDNDDKLIEISKTWDVTIVECKHIKDKIILYFEKTSIFNEIIELILKRKTNYGLFEMKDKNINIHVENEETFSDDLNYLRLKLLKEITCNILELNGCYSNESSERHDIILTNKNLVEPGKLKIVCGVVIAKGNSVANTSDLYGRRTSDMQLIGQRKYGCGTCSWDAFGHLASATVTVEFLHVNPVRSLTLNVDDPATQCRRGAPFILYNSARIWKILNLFNSKVDNKEYPALPAVKDINFSLLSQPEEWEILYVYLMNYPSVVKSSVSEVRACTLKIHHLCSFLTSLCSLFSAYYRRIKILTDPRSHLVGVVHARIYLLIALQQVIHNALCLFKIHPIKQM